MYHHSVKITFVDGFFAGHDYMPGDIASLCSLIKAASVLSSKTFLEIENEKKEFKFQIYCDNQQFCVFQDTYNHAIKVFGTPTESTEIPEYVQIRDDRWGTTNFLPKYAFVGIEGVSNLIMNPIFMGELGEHFEFSQLFPDLDPPDGYC